MLRGEGNQGYKMNRIRTLVALATLGVVFATALAILQAGIPSRATAGEHQGPTWVSTKPSTQQREKKSLVASL